MRVVLGVLEAGFRERDLGRLGRSRSLPGGASATSRGSRAVSEMTVDRATRVLSRGCTVSSARPQPRASIALLERLGLADPREEPTAEPETRNQQRVQLRAALVFSPDLLSSTNPSGARPVPVDAMTDVCERADAGKPVVAFSHQLDIVERVCDRDRDHQPRTDGRQRTVAELTERGPLRFWWTFPAPAPGGMTASPV